MERVEHLVEDDVIELGVASVETKGAGVHGEPLGDPIGYEISDQ